MTSVRASGASSGLIEVSAAGCFLLFGLAEKQGGYLQRSDADRQPGPPFLSRLSQLLNLLLSEPGIRLPAADSGKLAIVQEGRMIKEFQEFIAKGNVMDLAVGVIIGGAFGLIVSSLVDDIIMPVVGAIFGGFDFSNYFVALSSNVTASSLAAAREQGAVFAYGNFITVVINFLILAWIIFLMVKLVNNMRRRLEKEKEAVAEAAPADVQLLTEIRDLLAKK